MSRSPPPRTRRPAGRQVGDIVLTKFMNSDVAWQEVGRRAVVYGRPATRYEQKLKPDPVPASRARRTESRAVEVRSRPLALFVFFSVPPGPVRGGPRAPQAMAIRGLQPRAIARATA